MPIIYWSGPTTMGSLPPIADVLPPIVLLALALRGA